MVQLFLETQQAQHTASRTQCLRTIEAYQTGDIDAETALYMLEQKRTIGIYFAGELALQLAASAPTPQVSTWLDVAEQEFSVRNFDKAARGLNKYSGYAMRSTVRRAQLPLHRHVLATGTLPPQELVQDVYEETVEGARYFAKKLPSGGLPWRDTGRRALVGALSEVSVLLLGQRAAQQIDTTEWCPLQSTLYEDHANYFTGIPGSAWDISFFTRLDEQAPPERFCKVQVKTSNQSGEDASGITRVTVHPDLAIGGRKGPLLARQIIEECHLEVGHPDVAAQRVTGVLDKRVGKLLDKLDG